MNYRDLMALKILESYYLTAKRNQKNQDQAFQASFESLVFEMCEFMLQELYAAEMLKSRS